MSITTRPRRSLLMRLLRLSPGVFLLLFAAGIVLMVLSASGPSALGPRDVVCNVGAALLALSGMLFCTALWGGVYLNVVEASRGMPGLWSVEEPKMAPETATKFEELKRALTGLGFRPDEWFSLDDFDEMHICPWKHDTYHTVAFVMYFPAGGFFRLRFVRRFANGILITSTRITDLAYQPPQGMYLQARADVTVEELWAWHLEAESLFPTNQTDGAIQQLPRALYVEVSSRWATHRRRDRTWLLAVEPVEEAWRIYWLRRMPLSEQFEKGWTTPFWQ